MERRAADWELPAGVDRGLWDYAQDTGVARNYDVALAGSPLFAVDQDFVERHCPPGARLLDLGCGTGRLLVALARRGCTVVGVDLSAEMLAVAVGKALVEGLHTHLVRGNIVDLSFLAPASFDCAACLFSTLGMVRGRDNRLRALRGTYAALRPGGRLVLHVHNRWFNAWDRAGRRWLVRDWLRSWSGAEAGDRLMPPHQGIAGLTLHLFTRREAVRLVRAAGFRVQRVQPISLRADGRVPVPWWFGRLRAYGYLILGVKPGA